MATEREVQNAVWQIELGRGKIVVQWMLVVLLAIALSLVYTNAEFRGLNKRESMDMAQLARNIAHGRGFTTQMIRPLSLWHMQTYRDDHQAMLMNHPDLYNPPLYPLVLAGLFKMMPESIFDYKITDRTYTPERWVILPFNQLCLLLSLLVIYFWAKRLFDTRVAITTGLILLLSDSLWAHSISGLPTSFLMLLLLLAFYCLYLADRQLNSTETTTESHGVTPLQPAFNGKCVALIIASAVLLGLCFLTRYLTGFLLIPVLFYLNRILAGRRRRLWVAIYTVVFLLIISPWLVRNYTWSGSVLGIAQYDLVDRTAPFTGDILMRSLAPDFADAYSLRRITSKFVTSFSSILNSRLKHFSSDYLFCFFLVGLLYSFRRDDAAKLRHLILGGIIFSVLAMSLIGSAPERGGETVYGGDLLILLLPLVAVFAVAFFYLLLDRIPFNMKITQALVVGAFGLLNVSAIIFTLLPPQRGPFPYPPYMAPYASLVGHWFEPDEVAVSDLPWQMAWVGDRRTVWLPMTLDDFYQVDTYFCPRDVSISFLMLTPYMLDRRFQSELQHGEYKAWLALSHGQLDPKFPLKAVTLLPPDNEQILFARRIRWPVAQQPTESPAPATQPPPTAP